MGENSPNLVTLKAAFMLPKQQFLQQVFLGRRSNKGTHSINFFVCRQHLTKRESIIQTFLGAK
jgi:hypothetical protein